MSGDSSNNTKFIIKDHDLKGSSVLITGAAGCIGATVVKQLIESYRAKPIVFELTNNKSRLKLIMNSSESDTDIDVDKDVIWENGDISNYDDLNKVVQKHKNIKAIIHLAALQVPFCKSNPILGAQVNVVGTSVVFEVARANNIKRIVFASSVAAPAIGNNEWLDTLYGAHKVCGEQMAKVYWQDWQLPSVCIRPSVVYGPGRDQGMTSKPTLAIMAAMFDIPYKIPFVGNVAFLYVEDAAARFIGSIAKPHMEGAHVFDMNGTPSTVENVIHLIKKTKFSNANIDSEGLELPFPSSKDDGSLDKHIGISPYTSLEDGINQSIQVFEKAKAKSKESILTKEFVTKILS